MTQKQRIFEILSDGEWHSNVEIHEATGIYRYGARIFDLQHQDHISIETKYGKGALYFYKLIPKQQSLL